MPKLLDFLKDKEISHADAMKLIEEHFVKPEDESDESEEPDITEGEDDKPEDEIEEEQTDDEVEALVQKLADEEEAKIEAKAKADKVKLALMVQEELKKRGKITRKTPSKGKITDVPKLDYDINVKGYEVKSIRKKD